MPLYQANPVDRQRARERALTEARVVAFEEAPDDLSRDALRQLIEETQKRVAAAVRSKRCSGYGWLIPPRHAGAQDGCTDDGSACLCHCHDGAR